MRSGAKTFRGSRDDGGGRRYSERDFRYERNDRNESSHGDRQCSTGSGGSAYNGRGNGHFDRGQRARSTAPVVTKREYASRPPSSACQPATPRRHDQGRDDYDRRMPAQDIRGFGPNVRLPPSDQSRRTSISSLPCTTPTKPMELLAPENIRESIQVEETPFVEFTGGVHLKKLMFQKKNYFDVELCEPVVDTREEEQELVWLMKGLVEMVNPARTNPYVTFEDVVGEVVECSSVMNGPEAVTLLSFYGIIIGQEISRWLDVLFFASCCAAGYTASNFLRDDLPFFGDLPKNLESELEKMLQFVDLLENLALFDIEEVAKKVKEIRELTSLLKEKKTEELAKRNVTFAVTELDRLRFGMPVTEEEIYKIIDASVSEGCAHYLWIVDHCPEKVLHSARIAQSIIEGLLRNRLSKDQRLQRAFFLLMPSILASLGEDELYELVEKQMQKEGKLANWSEMMFQGYLMNLKDQRGRSKETDIVLIKLLEARTSDDLKHFLLSCALVAEFDPQRCPRSLDNCNDSFCTRIARVFIDGGISPEKRSLLLEALMKLPEPLKGQLLATEGSKVEHSLYHSVRAICTHMTKLSQADVRKWGSLVIRELLKVLSPARMLSFAVLPCLKMPEARFRAAGLLPELLACEKLPQELIEEREGLSPALLAKAGLDQYEEPEGTAPQTRYALIEEILNVVDVVLEGDVPQKMIDDVDAVFEEKKLSWQQHYSILHICFRRSQQKLKKPEIPTVDFSSLDGLKAFNITAILQSWPNPDSVRAVFERIFSDIFSSSEDFALASYAILSAILSKRSKIKDHFPFLREFLTKRGELVYKSEKEGAGGVEEAGEEQETWLSNAVLAEEIDVGLRGAVLRIAALSLKYSKEVARLQKIITPQKPPREKAPSIGTERPSNVSAPDVDENSNTIPSLEDVPAPASGSQRENEKDLKLKNPSIVEKVDYEGERFPDVFKPAFDDSDDSFNRCILWLNEDLARTTGDLVGFAKSDKFQLRMHRIVHYIGGRLPDIEANKNRKPLLNPHLPLYLEIQARPGGKESESRLKNAVECVKTALDEYLAGESRVRSESYSGHSTRDSREQHRRGGRGGRQRGGEGRQQQRVPQRQDERGNGRAGRGPRHERERGPWKNTKAERQFKGV